MQMNRAIALESSRNACRLSTSAMPKLTSFTGPHARSPELWPSTKGSNFTTAVRLLPAHIFLADIACLRFGQLFERACFHRQSKSKHRPLRLWTIRLYPIPLKSLVSWLRAILQSQGIYRKSPMLRPRISCYS